jgi:hypothetical protein
MPGKRIKNLTALSGAGSANDDDVVIFDTTADTTKRISRSQLAEGMQADVQVLTNKTLALGSNTVTGTTAQFNTALTDNNFATLAGSEVLTNKSFASAKGLSSTATPANNIFGFVDIVGTATSADVTFGTAETDTAYGVMFGALTTAGTPAAGSHNAYMTARATSGFTINAQVAPGVGNTVRVHWMLMR